MILRLAIFTALLACTPKKTESSLKVVNGRPLSETEFPSVVKISIDLGKGTSATCTSSVISDTVMITAAHCLVNENGLSAASATAVLNGGKRIPGGVIHLHPEYDNRSAGNDIAFAKFPAGTFKDYKPVTLSSKIPQKGDEIKIIGFGKNDHFDGTSGGTKRIGFSVVESVNKTVNFRGIAKPSDQSGKDAINSQGDSGGPMLDAQDEIVGISSTVDSIDAGDGRRTGHYTSIHDAVIVTFLNKFIDGSLPENKNPSPDMQHQPGDSENIGPGVNPGGDEIKVTPDTGTLNPIDIDKGICLCSVRANKHGTGCTVTRAGKVVLEANSAHGCESAAACSAAWQGDLSGTCTSFDMQ